MPFSQGGGGPQATAMWQTAGLCKSPVRSAHRSPGTESDSSGQGDGGVKGVGAVTLNYQRLLHICSHTRILLTRAPEAAGGKNRRSFLWSCRRPNRKLIASTMTSTLRSSLSYPPVMDYYSFSLAKLNKRTKNTQLLKIFLEQFSNEALILSSRWNISQAN